MVAGYSWSKKIRTATQHSGVCAWSYQNLNEAIFVTEEVTIHIQKNSNTHSLVSHKNQLPF